MDGKVSCVSSFKTLDWFYSIGIFYSNPSISIVRSPTFSVLS